MVNGSTTPLLRESLNIPHRWGFIVGLVSGVLVALSVGWYRGRGSATTPPQGLGLDRRNRSSLRAEKADLQQKAWPILQEINQL